jgi:transposase
LTKSRRGRPRTKNPLSDTVSQQAREIERLKKELYKAEVVIDVQKKLSALLGIAMPVTPTDGEEKP